MPGSWFEPLDYGVRVQLAPARLRPELDDLVQRYQAEVVRLDAQGAIASRRTRAIASLTWSRLAFGAALETGDHPKWDVAERQGPELLRVVDALLDDEGERRPQFDLAGEGNDLLHLGQLWVDPAFDYVEVGRELLHHVLGQHSPGCFASTFVPDEVPHIEMGRLLLDRGFRYLRAHKLFLLDLGRARPALVDVGNHMDAPSKLAGGE
jgi:hypothetical protein